MDMLTRIRDAFRPGEYELHFYELARRLYPEPQSWRYCRNGGPPGCAMALSAAIRRYNIRERIDGPGKRFVYRPREVTYD